MGAYDSAASEPISATGMLKNLESEDLGPARIKSIYVPSLAAGTIELRDGSATGRLRLNMVLVAGADALTLDIPGRGLRFLEGVHVTITGVTNVVMFYEG